VGAGKSTVIKELHKLEILQKYGDRVVHVEADAFKMVDPFFGIDDKKVHKNSVKVAEELLAVAIKNRRDIIFDGTMMWLEFVKQTVGMIRDNHHIYSRGEGYVKHPDGSTSENYWKISEHVPEGMLLPYRIWMIGVTVNPEIAVERAFIRHLITGRGVPISAQLNSHKLFSKNFGKYAKLVDVVKLYDNSEEGPIIIAEKNSLQENLSPVHEKYFARFKRKKNINLNAENPDAIFPHEDHEKPKENIPGIKRILSLFREKFRYS